MKSVDLALGSDVPQFYIGFSKSATIFVIPKKYFPAKSRIIHLLSKHLYLILKCLWPGPYMNMLKKKLLEKQSMVF